MYVFLYYVSLSFFTLLNLRRFNANLQFTRVRAITTFLSCETAAVRLCSWWWGILMVGKCYGAYLQLASVLSTKKTSGKELC